MFGHEDENQQNNPAPVADGHLGDQNSVVSPDDTQGAPALNNDSSDSQDYIMTDTSSSDTPSQLPPAVTTDDSAGLGSDASTPATPDDATPASGDLLSIKQQALEQLTPLVGHLDQTPEEKFRTTMMMIQASDNDALIKEAYAAAQGITDEKARAQALLDIVNEINYFTQNQHEN